METSIAQLATITKLAPSLPSNEIAPTAIYSPTVDSNYYPTPSSMPPLRTSLGLQIAVSDGALDVIDVGMLSMNDAIKFLDVYRQSLSATFRSFHWVLPLLSKPCGVNPLSTF